MTLKCRTAVPCESPLFGCPVRSSSDRERVQDLAVRGIKDHHRRGVPAGSEENIILGIYRQTRTGSALAGEIVVGGHHHCLCVHHRDVGLVFDIEIQVALPVGRTLLRHSAEIDGSKH